MKAKPRPQQQPGLGREQQHRRWDGLVASHPGAQGCWRRSAHKRQHHKLSESQALMLPGIAQRRHPLPGSEFFRAEHLIKRQPALDAELSGSSSERLGRLLLKVSFTQPVGTRVAGITAQGTEAAVIDPVLDPVIGDLEVAVHHVRDSVTRKLLMQASWGWVDSIATTRAPRSRAKGEPKGSTGGDISSSAAVRQAQLAKPVGPMFG